MLAKKVLLISLISFGFCSNFNVLIEGFTLRNFPQVETFCAQFGFNFSSQQTTFVQNSIGQWAAAQGNKDIMFWLSVCQSTTNQIIPNLDLTTTTTSTTPGPGKYYPLIYIGSSEVNGAVKQFWGTDGGQPGFVTTSWSQSLQLCRNKGLKLASLESAVDQYVVRKWAVKNFKSGSSFWTAGTNVGNPAGSWSWATIGRQISTAVLPSGTFEFWSKSEPVMGSNLCLLNYLWSDDRMWRATPCDYNRPALCETEWIPIQKN